MNKNEALYQLIDRYLAGEMEAQEQADFERRIEEDTYLAKLLERERKVGGDLDAFLTTQADEELLGILEELGDRHFEEEKEIDRSSSRASSPISPPAMSTASDSYRIGNCLLIIGSRRLLLAYWRLG